MHLESPGELSAGPVRLVFEKIVEPEKPGELVPFYHFKIIGGHGAVVGHINLRVGTTRHVQNFAGHIGYAIAEEHRGQNYSYFACLALAPFARRHGEEVVLTVECGNSPSIRIIEKLGASFTGEVDVPVDDPAYAGGARRKRRYIWRP